MQRIEGGGGGFGGVCVSSLFLSCPCCSQAAECNLCFNTMPEIYGSV